MYLATHVFPGCEPASFPVQTKVLLFLLKYSKMLSRSQILSRRHASLATTPPQTLVQHLRVIVNKSQSRNWDLTSTDVFSDRHNS